MAGVTIRRLSKTYAGPAAAAAAVNELDLVVRDNQFVTLLGPSGCGKTTTLRLIAGYMSPDAGTIHVDERLVSSPDSVVPPEHRGMGMVFQNYAVWPHKTVFENVVFGLKLRKIPAAQARARVEETLALVNLQGFENRLPSQLSGGQQQRVALARSLVVEPGILLLDEPLSNLDAKLRERMRGELKELQRRTGITFIYVTHDQAEALALSDQIAVMHAGRLQQFGTPHEVYTRPANRLVADFMGHLNLVPGEVVAAADGRLRVLVAGVLHVDVARPEGVRTGERIDVGVRPENVILTRSASAERPNVTAQVVDRTFLGNLNEYVVTLASGQQLRVQTHPKQQFANGESVGVAFDADEISVFRPLEAGRQSGDIDDRTK
jgi:iron(III) transport system ATP-binding protein